MTLQLFAHPFSSYCQKVLIALWADGTEFEYRILEQDHPENFVELKQRWPFGKFPLLVDDGETVVETTPIIGFWIAASSSPIARMKARCGVRASPSRVMSERSFLIASECLLSLFPSGNYPR